MLTWLNGVLLIVIVWRGWEEQLWGDFKAFYVWAAFTAVHSIASGTILATLGIGSSVYYYFFYSANTLTIFIGAWFFFDTLRVLSPSAENGIRLVRCFLLAAFALVVPVAWTVAQMDVNPLDRLQAVSLVYKMAVCLVAFCYVAEHREIELGANLGGLLTGMGLLTGCQSLNFISYFSGGIRHELFQILVPSLFNGGLLILLVSLWTREPVRFNAARGEFNLSFQQGFRLLLRALLTR